VSIVHANTQIHNLTPADEGAALRKISSMMAFVRRKAAGLPSVFRDRLEFHRMKRFSDHRLRDIGFERDWDGSLIRRQA